MNNIDYVGKAEFECSECEFKCFCEYDMINHSVIHQCTTAFANNVIGTVSNSQHSVNNKEDNIDYLNSQAKVNIRVDYKDASRVAVAYPGTYDSRIKSEPSLYEYDYSSYTNLGNGSIKIEHIEIKPENISYVPPQTYQVNHNEDICKKQNLCEEIKGLETKHSVNEVSKIFTEDRTGGDSLGSINNDESQYFTIKEKPIHRIEIKLDNKDIYIPRAWYRKGFITTKLEKGQIKYECSYITKHGNKISSKQKAHAHVKRYNCMYVDVEKLNFTIPEKMKNQGQSLLEYDIDNKGIYIPKGWQRKLNISINSTPFIDHNIQYICPEGKKFLYKSEIYSYLSSSASNVNIDVEEMNFSIKNHISRINVYGNKPAERKIIIENIHTNSASVEISVDNTGKYIPQGWERKVYQQIKGRFKGRQNVEYISPEGRRFRDKKNVMNYFKNVNTAVMLGLDINKFDFTMS